MDNAPSSSRRATVGGARPQAQPSTSLKTHGHRRSLSGSILSKLSFLKPPSEDVPDVPDLPSPNGTDDDASPKRSNAMATAVRSTKPRKRKGSLRKTAILGTGGKLRLDTRDRRNSLSEPMKRTLEAIHVPPPSSKSEETHPSDNRPFMEDSDDSFRRLSHETVTPWPAQNGSSEFTLESPADDALPELKLPQLGLPVPVPVNSVYASTTDDDEGLTFSRPAKDSLLPPASPYAALRRRRSSNKGAQFHSSPLSRPPSTYVEEEWDYSATEWWGWIILIVTWIVFVVGMGSCLGVWSWAWDVGETPYAPPELEDDPTLPIVGYYPALIILTAVMAWVWVVVAWMGMKYFRHAKVMVDEG
ncbi:hypothetical protein K402DRAFT_267277 [Aulographum hederae CBS 113979]|uniref:Uncharacterized protein n=1 Tax=Aulographum hederae CBS 113979 TaxID=1176131 RepID=A0A6G1GIJ4_9PEZI|nr:hypothetical protein K402DRAFT_267277 [Aulographum hederae CBS 113979]